jgi:hypothetical protein
MINPAGFNRISPLYGLQKTLRAYRRNCRALWPATVDEDG